MGHCFFFFPLLSCLPPSFSYSHPWFSSLSLTKNRLVGERHFTGSCIVWWSFSHLTSAKCPCPVSSPTLKCCMAAFQSLPCDFEMSQVFFSCQAGVHFLGQTSFYFFFFCASECDPDSIAAVIVSLIWNSQWQVAAWRGNQQSCFGTLDGKWHPTWSRANVLTTWQFSPAQPEPLEMSSRDLDSEHYA